LSRWDEGDLEARLCRALDLAKKTINCFSIDGYADSESPAYDFGPEKVVAETAMLIYAASASRSRPNIASRIDDLVRVLATHARSARVLVDIMLHPALAFKLAVPHILLTKLGYPEAGFDDFLRSCVSAPTRNAQDRPPSSALERQWIRSLWTGRDSDAAWRATLRNSLLSGPIDILGGLRTDAYAFTHLIFYCTDFGFRNPRLPRPRSVILAEAGALLVRFMDAEDYDLAGEILLAWPLIGAAWSPSAAFAFRVLASVEDQVGVLPCGNINLTRLARLEGEARARYALGNAYHTAYVMGFLCAASLRPGRASPVKIVGPRFEKTCLNRLLRYVDDDQGHWRPEFSSLAEEEQRALVPFVLNIAIVQKCRRRDYKAVAEILSLACEYGMARFPMCRQAFELLERIANCSTVIDLREGAPAEVAPLPHSGMGAPIPA
jgi:uncharacterized protein DUF6895